MRFRYFSFILICIVLIGSFLFFTNIQDTTSPSTQVFANIQIQARKTTVKTERPTPPVVTPPMTSGSPTAVAMNTCNNYLVIVDKQTALPAYYAPPDLVYLGNYFPQVTAGLLGREAMALQLQRLFADITKEGIDLQVLSAYRSYDTQVSLYNSYVQQYGQAAADRFSARPGTSQHQLGTAIDFGSNENNYQLEAAFGDTRAGRWLVANAHKYGLYISYPNGYEAQTGYMYEPWHFRFLGIEQAQKLQQSGMIMQHYLEQYGVKPSC